MTTPRKILIRGPNWIGDAVMGVPAMKDVRQRFPQAQITLLVRPWVEGLFRSAGFIDRIWTEGTPGWTGWLHTARRIRRERYDLAILLPNSFESALTACAGGIPRRVGYRTDGRGLLLTEAIPLPTDKPHQVEYYQRLIDAAFGDESNGVRFDTRIEATEEERRNAGRILADAGIDPDGGYIVINAGAAFGSAKRWPEDRFARVAEALSAELGMPVVMVGARGERPIAAAIQDAITSPSANLCGETDLETLVGVLARAALVVTNDSGPMHIAAALATPTLAIFGSTDPEVTSPRGPATRLVREPVDCSPCLLRECPIDHRCMERVTSESVLEVARAFVPAGSGPV